MSTNNGSATFSISGTTAVGQTLSISEDSADPDGTGTLSYSWQISHDYFGWATVGTSSTYTIRSSDNYASSDDGNIQCANYQSEEQMSDYLTSKGYESTISDII